VVAKVWASTPPAGELLALNSTILDPSVPPSIELILTLSLVPPEVTHGLKVPVSKLPLANAALA